MSKQEKSNGSEHLDVNINLVEEKGNDDEITPPISNNTGGTPKPKCSDSGGKKLSPDKKIMSTSIS